MSKSWILKLVVALIVLLAIFEVIDAVMPGSSSYKSSPQRLRRKRLVHEPFDPENVDPEDPYDEEEDRPPAPPHLLEQAATPKLVKGLNMKGESTFSRTLFYRSHTSLFNLKTILT